MEHPGFYYTLSVSTLTFRTVSGLTPHRQTWKTLYFVKHYKSACCHFTQFQVSHYKSRAGILTLHNTLSINLLALHTVPGLTPHRQAWNVRESKLGYSQKQDLKACTSWQWHQRDDRRPISQTPRKTQVVDSKQLPAIRCPENGAANSRKQLIYSRLHTTHFWAAGFRLRPS